MLAAESVEDLWRIFTEAMAETGFPRAIYGFTRDGVADALTDMGRVLFLSNHEPAYLEGFIGRGLYRDAPMVRWAADNVGASSWRHVAEAYAAGELTEAERKVIDFNRKMGVNAGYSISFRDASTLSKGALGLVGAPEATQDEIDGLWERVGRTVLTTATVLHLRMSSFPHPKTTALTPRQREALEWVAHGKTTQDIALLMGISVAMVEKHLRLARIALDVEKTSHAVAKAIRLNQIFLPG
ncbi:MAG: autoinducer binding domain-containing protein [Paracoccaceae bacterium]|nr:autoinducer binding domain-containing protein [Paracoccaceae bacterium]MDE3239413.1 autoinducer binding domain-containing protein [Paracoccaceae bacterium]